MQAAHNCGNERRKILVTRHSRIQEEGPMSVAEIMNYIAEYGLGKHNFEEIIPQMLRAICKDEYVDATEEFIRMFDDIDWNWWPNG